MCIGIPGQVVEIIDPVHRIASVDVSGRLRKVNLALLSPEEGAVGDWVLVHAGLARNQMDAAEAQSILELLREMDQLYQEALK